MLKKVLLALGAVLVLIVLGAAAVYGLAYSYTEGRLVKRWQAPAVPVTLSTDAVVVERGRHLVQHVLMCAQCHGKDLGGQTPYIDAAGIVTLNTPNITKGNGSIVLDYSPADVARMIRFGVRPDGTAAAVMPVQNFTNISDADLVAVVSYLDDLPPVDRPSTKSVFQPMGRVLWYFGVFDLQFTSLIDMSAKRPSTTPTDPMQHGDYLAHLSGCLDCHGAEGSGGPMPGAPPDLAQPANLTPHETGLKGWTRDDFANAVRGGRSKDGRALDKGMPFKTLAGLSDTEVDDLWTFTKTLKPKEFGGRKQQHSGKLLHSAPE